MVPTLNDTFLQVFLCMRLSERTKLTQFFFLFRTVRRRLSLASNLVSVRAYLLFHLLLSSVLFGLLIKPLLSMPKIYLTFDLLFLPRLVRHIFFYAFFRSKNVNHRYFFFPHVLWNQPTVPALSASYRSGKSDDSLLRIFFPSPYFLIALLTSYFIPSSLCVILWLVKLLY